MPQPVSFMVSAGGEVQPSFANNSISYRLQSESTLKSAFLSTSVSMVWPLTIFVSSCRNGERRQSASERTVMTFSLKHPARSTNLAKVLSGSLDQNSGISYQGFCGKHHHSHASKRISKLICSDGHFLPNSLSSFFHQTISYSDLLLQTIPHHVTILTSFYDLPP